MQKTQSARHVGTRGRDNGWNSEGIALDHNRGRCAGHRAVAIELRQAPPHLEVTPCRRPGERNQSDHRNATKIAKQATRKSAPGRGRQQGGHVTRNQGGAHCNKLESFSHLARYERTTRRCRSPRTAMLWAQGAELSLAEAVDLALTGRD